MSPGSSTGPDGVARPGPADVDRLMLRRYLAYLATRRYARASIARKAAALRAYFGWCRRRGAVPEDPARRLSAPSAGGRLPKVLSRQELSALLDPPRVPEPTESSGRGRACALRDDAVLELLYAAGLRVAELCGLEREGVDLPGRTVTVTGKGDKERRVPIHARCAEVLGTWLEHGWAELAASHSPPGAVFLNQRGNQLGPRDVRRIIDARSPVPTHPHALRHSFCHPPARRRSRPAGRPGAPRPRQPPDHADLHPRQQGPPREGLRGHPPPRLRATVVRPARRG